ncbi:MAG: hypothetical protein ACI39H_07285 [Lachnospiraceae bacterium]
MKRFGDNSLLVNGGLVCLGLLAGLLFIKISGHSEKSHLILCSEYFLYQYAYEKIDYRELLFYVCVNRLPLFLLLLVGSRSKNRKKVTAVVCFLCAFGITYLLGVSILRYGVRALALFFGLMTPQILFYVQSVFLILRQKSSKPWKSYGWGCIFFILGLLSEVYINPRWLRLLLELF